MFIGDRTLSWLVAGVIIFGCCSSREQKARAAAVEVPVVAEIASLAAYEECKADGNSFFKCSLAALLIDPSNSIQKFQVSIDYDPMRISVGPGAGFLCDFSSGGDCPSLDINGVVTGGPLHVGGPRAGTSYTYSVDATIGRITLDYDMSANPATEIGDRNVFAIPITPLFDFSGVVTPYYQTGGGHDASVSSVHCVATLNDQVAGCGNSQAVVQGLSFGTVPEPGAGSLLLLGLAGMAGSRWLIRRSRRRISTVQ